MAATAGIIANPASGKDIRRLVAHASVFDTQEKISIVRRVVLGLAATGVERVLFMPDSAQIVQQAVDCLDLDLEIAPVDGAYTATTADTVMAAAAMAAQGVGVIVCLGGDGTNRALAMGTSDVPVVPISTGTNNVFPIMMEGTIAGLAAGALACGAVDPETVAQRCKWIEVVVDGGRREVALIDAVLMNGRFVGSRAIWELDDIREVVLTRAQPDVLGMAAVGGMVMSVRPQDDFGLHLVLGQGEDLVRAPIAPGLVAGLLVARAQQLPLGASVQVAGPVLVALDGEREFSLGPGQAASLTVARSGPPVVDVGRCLDAARDAGFLRRPV